jgi:hypothetical protein
VLYRFMKMTAFARSADSSFVRNVEPSYPKMLRDATTAALNSPLSAPLASRKSQTMPLFARIAARH